MGPEDGFAIDILLEDSLPEHEPEALARAPPRRLGGLVHDVAQVIQSTGVGRLTFGKPLLARLAPFPGPCGEAKYLDLDPAAFERAGEYVGAHGRHRDRPAAH